MSDVQRQVGGGKAPTSLGNGRSRRRKWTMVAVPPVLLVTMYVAFQELTVQYGFPLGYLLAFGLYWSVWCIAVPIAVLGSRGVLTIFRSPELHFSQLGIATQFALWWPRGPVWFSCSCHTSLPPVRRGRRVGRSRHGHRHH
jgi:hypothetical protein